MKEKGKIKFILSENLNRLAKWLRILGYDAVLYKSVHFNTMVRLAIKENRIFLTRSKKIVNSSLKFSRLLIKSDDHSEQLNELSELLEYKEEEIFSRCILCNKELYEIQKEKISHLIPKFVYETYSEFKICRKCGRIFWRGTHYQEMKNRLEKLFKIRK
ncbi:MAG: Mut7-C RNAse domain-containing protein [Candidatus Cloacimonetes bacterium]|nr:Mut7-C RNAse domain-containing protein [Candidatus Cloacimonadota bacterium]